MFDKELKRLNDNIETTKIQAGIIRDRVTGHIRRNKGTYIGIVASGLVCGVGGASMRSGKTDIRITEFANMINGISWKPSQIMNNQFIIPALGDPGNIVQAIETGTVYASQGQAARELGVSPTVVSGHLNGKLENVKDLHLKVIGKAGHPIEV